MLPNPLHPAVVHFPVVLAVLLPFFAVGALWAIRRGAHPMKAWALPMALTAVFAASALMAVRTGEAQEDRVERVVPEQPFETHEEAGETLLIASGILLILMGSGLAPRRIGAAGRVLATLVALAVLGGAAYVGHTGGQLVYEHGAANAYTAALPHVESTDGSVVGGIEREHER